MAALVPALVAAGIAAAVIAGSACSLVVSTDGLSGGAVDGSSPGLEGGAADGPNAESGVDGGVLVEGGSATCPNGRGPAMVDVGGFCIDSTEVTQEQYRQFLDDRIGDAGGQPAQCSWNTILAPLAQGGSSTAYDPLNTPKHPVGAVDWCDAWTFCSWAGKRLCGKVGGGTLAFTDFTDPTQSEWQYVCTKGGTRTYPYGSSYVVSACVGEGSSSDLRDVGAASSCQGGFDGVFDMSGNVWEWEDACDPMCTDGTNGTCCRERGGGYSNSGPNLSCNGTSTTSIGMESVETAIGIRCCADKKN